MLRTLKKENRHVAICNNLVFGTGAVVLDDITIGNEVKTGTGPVVIKSVPPRITVFSVPDRVVYDGHKALALAHGNLLDPVAEVVTPILRQQDGIQRRLNKQSDMGHPNQI